MKKSLIAGFVLALLVPACAFAQDTFTGTWKMDISSMHETGGKPMVLTLKDGVYTSDSAPPISVKADGEDHPVSGHPQFDTVAVKVINDHAAQQTEKKNGKTVWSGSFSVAADGKTATGESTSNRNGSESRSTVIFDRVAKGAAGSNAVSGSWRLGHMVSASGDARTDTYKVDGNKLDYNSGKDGSYSGAIGGKAVPFMQDGKQSGTVSVKRMGKNILRETYFTDGKTRLTSTMTISADGKSMKTSNHMISSGATRTWDSTKQ
ncbi:MAG: hypothetical protein ABI129_00840, partial [Rhodanobacter sp.]